jgi:hypothetical protein
VFWLYDIPEWASLLIVVGSVLVVGLSGLFGLSGWVSRLHGERNHNEVVSYFWGAVVLFYGVMVGLIAVGVWEQFSSTDEKVALEASALGALYRDVSAYPEPDRSVLQADLRQYTQNVIHVSWPLLRTGLIPSQTTEILWRFQSHLTAFQPSNASQVALHEEAFRAYNDLLQLRRMRLHSVQSGLPVVVWIIVGSGAVITLSMSWFFKTHTFAVHFWMVTLTAILLGLIIWLLVMLDYPFRGAVSIGPDAFEQVYRGLMVGEH